MKKLLTASLFALTLFGAGTINHSLGCGGDDDYDDYEEEVVEETVEQKSTEKETKVKKKCAKKANSNKK